MSGLAVYGDLTTVLVSTTKLPLSFAGEGVEVLAPDGFVPTTPQSYELATQQAILRPEIARPGPPARLCMAVTQRDVFGPKATSWSAALDAAAFGGSELS